MKITTASLALTAALLAGCSTTPMQDAQLADVGSTGAALAHGAAEANPMGLALLPAKYLLTEAAGDSCETHAADAITWGAVGNNLAIVAGIASPLVAGAVAGVVYFAAADRPCEDEEAYYRGATRCYYNRYDEPIRCVPLPEGNYRGDIAATND